MSLNQSPAGMFRLTAHPSCNLNASVCLFHLGGSINNKSSSIAALYASTGWLRWWMRQRVTRAAFVELKCNSETNEELDWGSVNKLNKRVRTDVWPRCPVTLCVHRNQTLPVCCSCLTFSAPHHFSLYFPSQFPDVYSTNKTIFRW